MSIQRPTRIASVKTLPECNNYKLVIDDHCLSVVKTLPGLNQLRSLERSKRFFTVMMVFGLLAGTEITSLGKLYLSLTISARKNEGEKQLDRPSLLLCATKGPRGNIMKE